MKESLESWVQTPNLFSKRFRDNPKRNVAASRLYLKIPLGPPKNYFVKINHPKFHQEGPALAAAYLALNSIIPSAQEF